MGTEADAPEGIRGEFKPIDTKASGVKICEPHAEDGGVVADKVTCLRSCITPLVARPGGLCSWTTGTQADAALQYHRRSARSPPPKLMTTEKGVPAYVKFNESRRPRQSGYLGTRTTGHRRGRWRGREGGAATPPPPPPPPRGQL